VQVALQPIIFNVSQEEFGMKKLMAILIVALLAGGVAFAQG